MKLRHLFHLGWWQMNVIDGRPLLPKLIGLLDINFQILRQLVDWLTKENRLGHVIVKDIITFIKI